MPPQKIYIHREFAKVFGPAGTGAEIPFTPTGLGSGSAWVSQRWDRGDNAVAERYIWRIATKVAATPVLDKFLTAYLITGDGVYVDGNIPNADQALPSVDLLKNLRPIGSVSIDKADAAQIFTRSGVVEILDQHVQVCWHSEFAVGLSAVDADHYFSLTAAPLEVQS